MMTAGFTRQDALALDAASSLPRCATGSRCPRGVIYLDGAILSARCRARRPRTWPRS